MLRPKRDLSSSLVTRRMPSLLRRPSISSRLLTMAVLVCGIVSRSSAAQTQVGSRAASAKLTPFPVCMDDSDCKELGQGNKYACFRYICYPWKDDTHLDPMNRRRTCRDDVDCGRDQECYKHGDMRQGNRGICYDQSAECDSSAKCPRGKKCCGKYCCEESYFSQFRVLPCVSHFGCEDYHLGKFCCPRKNSTRICCDVDPSPRTTLRPYTASSATGGSHMAPSLAMAVCLASITTWARFRPVRDRSV